MALDLQKVFRGIDLVNREDPATEEVDGVHQPKDWLYGVRMSERLAKFRPDASEALQVACRDQPVAAPCVLLSGGETTVTVRGHGRGGRNVEFLLSLGLALRGEPGIHALAGDTDGVDGQEEIAGAVLTPDTLARAWARGIKARERLDDNDGHGFFEALGDSVVTGPTLTNVNDFRAIVIDGPTTGSGASR